ncbi:MAG: hypothetical protein C0434_01795 [Xanthomonadaceae bacterium]|nr:hypothetical protein [Xanthomonadaceae bacterium]
MFSILFPQWPVRVFTLAVLLGLSSFQSSGATALPADAAGPPASDSSCDWTEPDGNTAYPETHARYFRLALPRSRTRGLRLRIDGHYLAARYFSYQLYGSAFNAIDVLSDHRIQPNPGSQSPLTGITRIDPAIRPGGQYTVYVVFADRPAHPAPNTLYAGASALPIGRNYLFLRAYLSNGVVPLPVIRYERDDGSPAQDSPIERSACADGSQPPSLKLRRTAVNDDGPLPALRLGGQQAGSPLPAAPGRDVPFEVYRPSRVLGSGVVYNQDAGFMSARIENRNELVLVRFRAPSFPALRGPVVPEVRYWSLCQNRQLLQTVIACVADRDAIIDASGFFHAVIGDFGGRPPGADARHGFSYLPNAGLVDNGFLIYRQLLSRPGFGGAITSVPPGASPQTVLGDYSPQATTCPRALFTARSLAGDSAAQVYAACRAAR